MITSEEGDVCDGIPEVDFALKVVFIEDILEHKSELLSCKVNVFLEVKCISGRYQSRCCGPWWYVAYSQYHDCSVDNFIVATCADASLA